MKLLGSSSLFATLTEKNKNYQKLCQQMDQTILQLRDSLQQHQELLARIETGLIAANLFPELRQEIQTLLNSKNYA